MRWHAGTAVNLAAWAVILLLIVAALFLVNRLGFAGLFLLGIATTLVCSLAALDQNGPVWGREVFRARMERPSSPEQRAALHDDQQQSLSPLRFFARCGLALAAIGAMGFIWQEWYR